MIVEDAMAVADYKWGVAKLVAKSMLSEDPEGAAAYRQKALEEYGEAQLEIAKQIDRSANAGTLQGIAVLVAILWAAWELSQ